MAGWDERQVRLRTGVELHVLEAGAGPLVVLLHGFPELGYSWRHQIPVLAEAGYRVGEPDQRGYGGSTRPAAVEAYDLDSLAADVAALIGELGGGPATVIGHDWGAPVAWRAALRYTDLVGAVGSLSVPHAARSEAPPLELMRRAAGPEHVNYVDYFQRPGVVDAEFASNAREMLLAFMWSIAGDVPRDERFRPIRVGARFTDSLTLPTRLPPWLTEADLDVYAGAFERTGFTGGLNWYRNVTRNWEQSADLSGAVVQQPAMFVTGSQDPARNPAAMARLREVAPGLRVEAVLEGCGHWTQQERPGEVNALLLEFLAISRA